MGEKITQTTQFFHDALLEISSFQQISPYTYQKQAAPCYTQSLKLF